jgi:hypothetical protein
VSIANVGPGCATGVNVIYRAYGNNGAAPAPQLGFDIAMQASAQALATFVWKPGVSLVLTSITGFADVRSANTVFKFTETHTNVACPS